AAHSSLHPRSAHRNSRSRERGARIATEHQRSADGLAVPFGGRFPLLFSLFARGIARVSLKFTLVFELLGRLALALSLGLAYEGFAPQLLLPGGLFGRTQGGFGGGFLRLALGALGVAHDAGLENRFALGLALDHCRVSRIIFRVGEEFLRHCLAGLRGGGLAVSESVAVQKRHRIPRRLIVGNA